MTENNPTAKRARQPLLLIILLTGLSACAGTSSVTTVFPPVGSETSPPAREEQSESIPVSQAPVWENDAEFYLQAADEAEGNERNSLLLRAAETAHLQNKGSLALEILEFLELRELPANERHRSILLLAELGQFADRPLTLLTELSPPDANTENDLALRIWGMRAQSHLTLGQTLEAIDALVQQEQYLSDPAARRIHQESIWRTLRSAPPLDNSPQELMSYGRTTQGWAELADIMLDLWLGPDELHAAIADWERNHARHPANQVVLAKESYAAAPTQSAFNPYTQRDGVFDTIALMLPLSGSYATPAAAVRDGFMTAYYRRPEPRPEVIVFDTGNPNDSIERIAEQAILAGADILVGPLSKNNVAKLAMVAEIPIPTLALNYLEENTSLPAGFYQFGLSPEDEASQVADRAIDDGRLNALAMVPDTDWGRRTLQAFHQQLHNRGGQLLDYEFFDPEKSDFREQLTRLLKFRAASKKEDVPASIREDMDYIFLAAQPQQARIIRPQLRFFRATYVPVYATSHVYSGSVNQRRDQDLNGIRFGDMPWILDQGDDLRDARELAARLWPDSYAQLPRLYAMGFDAYALATQIAKDNLRQGYGYPAASGVLTLQDYGRISRGLVWAHFNNGLAQLLGTNPPLEAPLIAEPEITEEIEDSEQGYLPEELLE